MSVYDPETILLRQNRLCCLQPNFRRNALDQVLKSGGTRKEAKANFRATRDACCELFRGQARAVGTLKKIGYVFRDEESGTTDASGNSPTTAPDTEAPSTDSFTDTPTDAPIIDAVFTNASLRATGGKFSNIV